MKWCVLRRSCAGRRANAVPALLRYNTIAAPPPNRLATVSIPRCSSSYTSLTQKALAPVRLKRRGFRCILLPLGCSITAPWEMLRTEHGTISCSGWTQTEPRSRTGRSMTNSCTSLTRGALVYVRTSKPPTLLDAGIVLMDVRGRLDEINPPPQHPMASFCVWDWQSVLASAH